MLIKTKNLFPLIKVDVIDVKITKEIYYLHTPDIGWFMQQLYNFHNL